MEKTSLVVLLAVLALLVGLSTGYVVGNATAPEKVVEVPVNHTVVTEKLVEVPGESVEVEVPVADASLYLSDAQAVVFDKLGDKSSFLTCDGHEFDEDEVKVSRTSEWSYNYLDADEYEVSFTSKFEFQDDSDERDCKETRTYTVLYEDGEKPVVS